MNFLASKTKVAPLKSLTVPRLELLSCFLLSKLLEEVKFALSNRLEFNHIFCWSDSEVAICWIKGKEKTWKPWVENRVVSIRKVVDRDCWSHVAGIVNPADIPTRMCNNFVEGRWFLGPEYLLSFDFELKKFDVDEKLRLVDVVVESRHSGKQDLCKGEREIEACAVEHVNFVDLVEHVETCKHTPDFCSVIDVKHYSSLKKLIMVTGYVFRFVNNMRNLIKGKNDEVNLDDTLTLSEYNYAVDKWIKYVQFQLKSERNFEKLKASLNLYFDGDNLIPLKGRFGNSSLTYQEQQPILLRSGHQGIESTLSSVRSMYWICKGRKTVKELLRKCVVCKRFQRKTLIPPASPDLPDFRVNHLMNAFQATILDFAGPLFVKEVMYKDISKVYILLLTCANSRAIHLELVPTMKIPEFLRGFKRFIARCGVPDIIVHDNFKTFKSVEVKRYMLQQGICQRFILPASPWWGGFYERLVRTVKLSLVKSIGKSMLSYEELETVLCEIESVINSRPLVYVSEDDLNESLTPHHLMYGRDITKPNKLLSLYHRIYHMKIVRNEFNMYANYLLNFGKGFQLVT